MREKQPQPKLRFTCPPCGEVFAAGDEEAVLRQAVEHARKFHDLDLLEQHSREELRAMLRRENESYWARLADLLPEGEVKTVLDEKLCEREREIVAYVVHGFSNREIAARLFISERTVSTHLVNIFQKLNVHSRTELASMLRATDRIIEASLRAESEREYGPFVHSNGPAPR